ncbi:MAG: cobalamin-binding protein [Ktedonobacteraceae bacterium]|nr:cobalamin-binding protein [Ktedonobacteraceae bacterium]
MSLRIISLLASATEMIAALGCLEQLVGRSHECDYPPEVQRLPLVSAVRINVDTSSAEIDAQIRRLAQNTEQEHALRALSIYSIDVDLLRRLQPDIIFTQTQCEVCAVSERDVVQALEQTTGLRPRIVSLAPYRLGDVWEDMLRVGEALGRREQAGELVRGYQNRLDQLKQKTEEPARQQGKPRVAVLEWLDPLMAAGNWTPELLDYTSSQSLFGEVGSHSPRITWQMLQATDPDVLVLCPCGFTLERTLLDVPLLQRHPLWQTLTAVQHGRVYAIDGNFYLNRSGPRLVESAELLARVIWDSRLDIAVDKQAWRRI